MKIWVCATMRDEAEILPFWLRHYEKFADRIMVFDDRSTDGTTDILKAHPLVEWHQFPYHRDMHEDDMLKLAHDTLKDSAGHCQWIIWVDSDEFIYHPEIRPALECCRKKGIQVIMPQGYQMIHPGLPEDDGKSQIWELARRGFPDSVYSKPVIVAPGTKILWVRGKHEFDVGMPGFKMPVYVQEPSFKLLHYRYLGEDYTRQRHARNWKNTPGDKVSAWAVRPFDDDKTRLYSPKWAAHCLTINHPYVV